ncbi:MAG: aldo/keto reductase [Pedococcus sp.]
MTSVPNLQLSTGADTITIPQLGFEVWQVPDADVDGAISCALEVGYRSIDTATIYGNEDGVGRALAATDLPRDDLFVTSKVWNDAQGHDATLAAFDASMQRLGLDVLDLYLIHWPAPEQDTYVQTWKALLELREFHAAHGILTEAWSPLASGGSVLTDDVVRAVADKHAVTPAQAILRWHIQLGNVVIPKSVTPSRIAENFDLFGFELDAQDLAAFAPLDRGARTGPDPLEFS